MARASYFYSITSKLEGAMRKTCRSLKLLTIYAITPYPKSHSTNNPLTPKTMNKITVRIGSVETEISNSTLEKVGDLQKSIAASREQQAIKLTVEEGSFQRIAEEVEKRNGNET